VTWQSKSPINIISFKNNNYLDNSGVILAVVESPVKAVESVATAAESTIVESTTVESEVDSVDKFEVQAVKPIAINARNKIVFFITCFFVFIC